MRRPDTASVPSALSCEVGSHFILISTAHPWEVSYGALIADYPKYINTMRRPNIDLFFQIIPSGMHSNRTNNPYSIKEVYGSIRPLTNIPITGKHYCGNIEEQERHNHKGELS